MASNSCHVRARENDRFLRFALSSHCVEPDLLFVGGDQLDILTKANVQGVPALVVEVLSPGTRKRDQGIKRQLFDRAGVREYWLVDPDRNSVRVLRGNEQGSLSEVAHLTSAERGALTTPLLPEFSLAVDEFLAD